MARHVVLVGLMGSGKSTIGGALADALDWKFVDTDRVVEGREECSVAQFFASHGEGAFREIESDVLREVLANPIRQVVATGGGIVMAAQNRQLLREHEVIWLTASVETLTRRVEKGRADRPLLGDDARARLTVLARDRSDLYADVATRRESVEGRDVDDIVRSIAASLVVESVVESDVEPGVES